MKTKSIWKINAIATAILVGSSLPVIAQAAETTATLEEVVVVGSRGAPRSVGDSPVPVDVISADELGKAGSNDLMMQLQGAVPSLKRRGSAIEILPRRSAPGGQGAQCVPLALGSQPLGHSLKGVASSHT